MAGRRARDMWSRVDEARDAYESRRRPRRGVEVLELETADGLQAEVVVSYYAGEGAVTWGPPDDWHPGEPGYVEPMSVTVWDVEDPDGAVYLTGEDCDGWTAVHWREIAAAAERQLGVRL